MTGLDLCPSFLIESRKSKKPTIQSIERLSAVTLDDWSLHLHHKSRQQSGVGDGEGLPNLNAQYAIT
jgi:hypothetical protein